MWSAWETVSAFFDRSCPALLPAILVVAAPLVGALMMGVDRKLTARIQGRIGPPILQPVYDVLKLFAKEPIFLNRLYIFYVLMHLAFMILAVVLLAMGQDILIILFVHAFSTISLILGALSVRSPYSRIGAQRKIMQMVAYEPVLILFVVGFYLSTPAPHSFLASGAMHLDRPLLFSLPLLLPAYFAAVVIKMEKSPFDVSAGQHAHQELIRGVTLEYSGPFLAVIKISHFYEVFFIFMIMAMFWSTNLWIGIGLALATFFAQIVVDNACARLTTFWMVRFMWGGPMLLALCNIIWLYGMGRG